MTRGKGRQLYCRAWTTRARAGPGRSIGTVFVNGTAKRLTRNVVAVLLTPLPSMLFAYVKNVSQ